MFWLGSWLDRWESGMLFWLGFCCCWFWIFSGFWCLKIDRFWILLFWLVVWVWNGDGWRFFCWCGRLWLCCVGLGLCWFFWLGLVGCCVKSVVWIVFCCVWFVWLLYLIVYWLLRCLCYVICLRFDRYCLRICCLYVVCIGLFLVLICWGILDVGWLGCCDCYCVLLCWNWLVIWFWCGWCDWLWFYLLSCLEFWW